MCCYVSSVSADIFSQSSISLQMLMFAFYPCVSLLLSFSDDHSRVILSLTENDPESHYINANYIDVSDIMKLCLK